MAVFDPNQITSPACRSNPQPGTCHTLLAQPNAPVAFPLDLRNAGRDPDKHDEQNRQGCGIGEAGDPSGTVSTAFVPGVATIAQGLSLRGREGGATAELSGDVMPALRASQGGGDKPHAMTGMAVRRLTPRECERLQGFPDDWTKVPNGKGEMADGPRYKMCGNSMAVPVMRWIGERIDMVEAILEGLKDG